MSAQPDFSMLREQAVADWAVVKDARQQYDVAAEALRVAKERYDATIQRCNEAIWAYLGIT